MSTPPLPAAVPPAAAPAAIEAGVPLTFVAGELGRIDVEPRAEAR
jgi:hypothetical protein